MKASVLTGLLALIASVGAFSQDDDKAAFGESDPKAKAILDKVSHQYKQYTTIRALFTLTIDAPEDDVNEEQSGTIYIKDNKYKLELEDMEIICDNTTRWIYTKAPEEVQINYYEPEENPMENPAKIFTIYEEDFLYRLAEDRQEAGHPIAIIELTPFDKDNTDFHKIKLAIDRQAHHIIRATTFSKNGVRYVLEIKNLTSDLDLSDSFFTFDPKEHPGIEVVDLR